MNDKKEKDRLRLAGRRQATDDQRRNDGSALAGTQAVYRPEQNEMSYANSTAAPNANPGNLAPPGSRGSNPNIDTYEEEVRYTVYGQGQDAWNPEWTNAQNMSYQNSLGEKYRRLMGYEDDRKARENTARELQLELFNQPPQRAAEMRAAGESDEDIFMALDLEFGANYDRDRVTARLDRDASTALEAGRNDAVISAGEQTTRSDQETIMEKAFNFFEVDENLELIDEAEYKEKEAEGFDMSKYTFTPAAGIQGKNLDESDTRQWYFDNQVQIETQMSLIETAIDQGITPSEVVAMSQTAISQLEATGVDVPAHFGLYMGAAFSDYQNRRDQMISGYDNTGALPISRNIEYQQSPSTYWGGQGGSGFNPDMRQNVNTGMVPSVLPNDTEISAGLSLPRLSNAPLQDQVGAVVPGSLGDYADYREPTTGWASGGQIRDWLGNWRSVD
tara:strand:+ start:697 stop:2034 length:1338 start_codon:yes stop_codon:yes gene_type:complete